MASRASRTPGLRLGLWSAVATVALVIVTAAVAVTTPPRSGPLCEEGCVSAPYTDVAAFVPRDYLWLYPAVALQLAFMLLAAVVAGRALHDRPGEALAAFGFTVFGAALLVTDYGLQLFVVQPSLLARETEGLPLLTQYNPHGVFIGLENLGYVALATGFLLLSAALAGARGALSIARWVFLVGGIATWVALVGLAYAYGARLEYRFELAAISLNWLVLALSGGCLAAEFRRASTVPEYDEEAVP